MATSNDDPLKDFLDECPDIPTPPSFRNCHAESDLNDGSYDVSLAVHSSECSSPPDIPTNAYPPLIMPDNSDASLPGVTPELNTSDDPSAFIPHAVILPSECLQIIAQPDCSTRVRYRKDYEPSSKRRDALINKNPSSTYTGPAVLIPRKYCDLTQNYFLGVSLLTPMHENTQWYFAHPYELESIDHADYNDRSNNIVWYPMDEENLTGSKGFPDLRIVRKTEEELENYGNLRPFFSYSVNLLNNYDQSVLSRRRMVAEYNLKKGHLAFFIGQRIHATDEFPTVIESPSTEISQVMILVPDASTDKDEKSMESTSQPSTPPCSVDQYAPRYGYTGGNDLMLIFLTKKPDERKNGKIQITFQSPTPTPEWSVAIDSTTIKVKEQTVSFRTPGFPQPINASTLVHVILRQKDRPLGTLEYFYIPQFRCATCQTSATNTPDQFMRSNSNKRSRFFESMCVEERDAIVPVAPSTPEFRSLTSLPESTSSNTTPEASTSAKATDVHESPLREKLHESIELLFTNNDYKPLLRLCRRSVQKTPEWLHTAIENNYSDLVSKFIPVAGIDLMKETNQHGETALLQAVRLNHVPMVKVVLERREADQLLENTDGKGRNIFHILALNTNSEEICHLIIDHLLKQSIDTFKQFDQMDGDDHTPLELAVINSNLSFVRHFVKYFNSKRCNHAGENLIHLAVRQGDLTMLEHLLDEKELFKQRNQTSLTMTPLELAESLNSTDLVNYLKKFDSQSEINQDNNSDND